MNERRKRILELKSLGSEVPEIAELVELSIGKTYHELEIARELLSAKNDCHAVRLALEQGLIKLSK